MSILAQQEKYDPQEVEADLANLQREIDDEVEIAKTLAQDSAQTLTILRQWVSDNSDRVRDQHKRMLVGTAQLKSQLANNVNSERADSELREFIDSEACNELARLLSELRAMSDEYKQLLLDTGRNGRPPLF